MWGTCGTWTPPALGILTQPCLPCCASMKEILSELNIPESEVNFQAFVRIFSHRKRRNGQMQFEEVDEVRAATGLLPAARWE